MEIHGLNGKQCVKKSNNMSKHNKVLNIGFRRTIKNAWTFSYLGWLAGTHQSTTKINKSALSTCSIFFSQSVHNVEIILS